MKKTTTTDATFIIGGQEVPGTITTIDHIPSWFDRTSFTTTWERMRQPITVTWEVHLTAEESIKPTGPVVDGSIETL